MRAMQLRLVKTDSIPLDAYSASEDPVARLFGEWLDWFGKSSARTKLGPARRAAIGAALQMYDEQMLVQALVGAAADEWLAQQDGLGIEWVLANESRIERFAEAGLRIQARAAAMPVAPAAAACALTPEQVAEGAAQRERMRALVRRLSGRGADAG